MGIDRFFTTTFNLTRQKWIGDSSSEISKSSFSGHIQQLDKEKRAQLDIDFSIAFTVWCDDAVDVQEGDVLDDGTFTYNVEAIQRNTTAGNNRHKELLVNRNKMPVSR